MREILAKLREKGENDSSVAKGNSFRRLGSDLSRLVQNGLKIILSNQKVEQGLQIYQVLSIEVFRKICQLNYFFSKIKP